jgi:2-polyprenyl-3-methyl-5-hydroxy-6-metoxy-1,4-benzoquinol methylase
LPRLSEQGPTYYPDDYHAYHRETFSEHPRLLASLRNAVRRAVLATFYGYPIPAHRLRGWRRAVLWCTLPLVRGRAIYGLGPRFPSFVANGRLLEVGCGDGTVLSLLRDLGWSVEGVDIGGVARERAWERFRILVHQGELPDVDLPEGAFDVILMSHVLEHVTDPFATLQRARDLLSARGSLLLVVPNARGLGFRLFGRYWGYLDPPRHIWQFSLESLLKLTARAGLRVEQKGSPAPLAVSLPWATWRCYRVEGQNAHKRPPSPSPLAFRLLGHALRLIEATLARLGINSGEEIFLIAGRA